jgi:hypothetical protein
MVGERGGEEKWRGPRFQNAFRLVVYPLPRCRILNSPLEIWS